MDKYNTARLFLEHVRSLQAAQIDSVVAYLNNLEDPDLRVKFYERYLGFLQMIYGAHSDFELDILKLISKYE